MRVDRLDVLVERVAVERLALLRLEVDPDRVLLDADVALDPDAAHGRGFHRRSALGRRQTAAARSSSCAVARDTPSAITTASSHRRQRRPRAPVSPAASPHAPGAARAPTAAGSMRPADRRSVRSMAAASRSLCVATTSVEPLSSFSSSSSSCTRSPVAGSRLPGRLVGEEQPRPPHHGPRHRHPLLLAARQLRRDGGPSGRPARRARAAPRRAPATARARLARDQRRQHDVLERGEVAEQVMELEDEAHLPVAQRRELRLGQREDVDAVEEQAAAGSASRGTRGGAAACSCRPPTPR